MKRRDFLKLLATSPLLKRLKWDDFKELEKAEADEAESDSDGRTFVICGRQVSEEDYFNQPYFWDGGVTLIDPPEQLLVWDAGGASTRYDPSADKGAWSDGSVSFWICEKCRFDLNYFYENNCHECNAPRKPYNATWL